MDLADILNQACACTTVEPTAFERELGIDAATHPHLFSPTLSFVSAQHASTIADAVAAVDRIAQTEDYRQLALGSAPLIAQHRWGPTGAFMGYDFHLSAEGPRLIEINTNAGGAVLNAAVLRLHHACCESMAPLTALNAQATPLETQWVEMLRAEWAAQRGSATLRTIAIVDDAPSQQYLAPEFTLFAALLERHGLQAVVADAQDLTWQHGALWHPALPGQAIDLVYNRLTDFYLSDPVHQALRAAYTAGATVVTPHPQVHATHADKRRLITLSDDALLAQWGVSEADRQLLQRVVPRTLAVTPDNADDLWATRRQLFFKPTAGYGSKGTYRGDKLTRKVWDSIVAGDYVAQALVPPSERLVHVDGEDRLLKQDVRAYAYQGQVQLLAARSYTGQTTNFRTPGGGFSPVMVLPPAPF